jgi:hypothetical protein
MQTHLRSTTPSPIAKRFYRGTVYNADTPQVNQSTLIWLKGVIEELCSMQTHLRSDKPFHMDKGCHRGTVFNADTPQNNQDHLIWLNVA